MSRIFIDTDRATELIMGLASGSNVHEVQSQLRQVMSRLHPGLVSPGQLHVIDRQLDEVGQRMQLLQEALLRSVGHYVHAEHLLHRMVNPDFALPAGKVGRGVRAGLGAAGRGFSNQFARLASNDDLNLFYYTVFFGTTSMETVLRQIVKDSGVRAPNELNQLKNGLLFVTLVFSGAKVTNSFRESRASGNSLNYSLGVAADKAIEEAGGVIGTKVGSSVGAKVGGVVGAALGSFLGPKGTVAGYFVGTALGAVGGAIIGNDIGRASGRFIANARRPAIATAGAVGRSFARTTNNVLQKYRASAVAINTSIATGLARGFTANTSQSLTRGAKKAFGFNPVGAIVRGNAKGTRSIPKLAT